MADKVFTSMIGQVMKHVVAYGDQLDFIRDDGKIFRFCHLQDCCESVFIQDIDGNLNDLVGSPLVMAEDVSSVYLEVPVPEIDVNLYDSMTWTYYKFATINGYVTVRWLGTSNGYYSESVDFVESKINMSEELWVAELYTKGIAIQIQDEILFRNGKRRKRPDEVTNPEVDIFVDQLEYENKTNLINFIGTKVFYRL